MTESEVLQGLLEIMKTDGWRKSPSNMFCLFSGNLSLERGPYPQLDNLIIEGRKLNFDFWDDFKKAYDQEFGKRKKASKPAKMVTVSVGTLLRETEKAYQFSSGKITNKGNNGPELAGIWVPKSQVIYNDNDCSIEMPVWLAIEKNWMQGR